MCTADVKRLNEATRKLVMVVGLRNKSMWSEVFENNPRMTREARGAQLLLNGPGLRPYIRAKTTVKWTWNRNRNQQAGEIFLTEDEKKFGQEMKGYVLIEPNIKMNNSHRNKAWPFERWQAVVNELHDVPLVQIGGPGTRWLERVKRIETPTFRNACSILYHCRAFIGTEGALHHASAALGIPAIVLWSEFISPDVTGYSMHTNIRHAGEPCGMRIPCSSCEKSMLSIPVEEVVDAAGRVAL